MRQSLRPTYVRLDITPTCDDDSHPLENLLGEVLMSKAGEVGVETVFTKTLLVVGGTLGLYFASQDSTACKKFAPYLKSFYLDQKRRYGKFEMVLVSLDHDETKFVDFFFQTPGLAIGYGDGTKRAKLVSDFGVTSLPSLIFLDIRSLEVLDRDGINQIITQEKHTGPYNEQMRDGEVGQWQASTVNEKYVRNLPKKQIPRLPDNHSISEKFGCLSYLESRIGSIDAEDKTCVKNSSPKHPVISIENNYLELRNPKHYDYDHDYAQLQSYQSFSNQSTGVTPDKGDHLTPVCWSASDMLKYMREKRKETTITPSNILETSELKVGDHVLKPTPRLAASQCPPRVLRCRSLPRSRSSAFSFVARQPYQGLEGNIDNYYKERSTSPIKTLFGGLK